MEAGEIVSAAVRLTKAQGLEGWSLRQLAEVVGCWPTAIAHHVGDRYAIEYAVVDRIAATVDIPDEALPWREWFQALLVDMRVKIRPYPGVARWFSRHGPVVPSALVIVDKGIGQLMAAGLPEPEAGLAYITLASSALLPLVSAPELVGPSASQDRIVQAVAEIGDADLPRMAVLAREFADPRSLDNIMDYTLARTLDGIATRIAECRQSA